MSDKIEEKLKMEEIEIKEEDFITQKEDYSSSSLEETCSLEDVEMENMEMKGKLLNAVYPRDFETSK